MLGMKTLYFGEVLEELDLKIIIIIRWLKLKGVNEVLQRLEKEKKIGEMDV